MSREQLKDRWRALYKVAPPAAFTPDLLARGIAWKLPERLLSGLSQEAKALLGVGSGGEGRAPRGAWRLVQPCDLAIAWSAAGEGRTYVVEATEAGLSYDGAIFGSLSEGATKITGTRCSGLDLRA